MAKFISTMLIYLCSFQLAFGEVIRRVPASQHMSEKIFNELGDEMREVRRAFRGDYICGDAPKLSNDITLSSETNEDISKQDVLDALAQADLIDEEQKEANQSDYYLYLEKLLNLDFSQNAYSVDKISSEIKKEGCEFPDSIIQKISEAIGKMDIEDSEAQIEFDSDLKNQIQRTYKRALDLKVKVKELISSEEYLDYEQKEKLLIRYIEDIALSIHDFSSVIMPFAQQYKKVSDFFMIPIPLELFYANHPLLSYYISGINPHEESFKVNYKISEEGDYWDWSFDEFAMASRNIKSLLYVPGAQNYLLSLRTLTTQMMISQLKKYQVIAGDYRRTVTVPKTCSVDSETGLQNGYWSQTVLMDWDKDNLLSQNIDSEKYLSKLLFDNGLTYYFDQHYNDTPEKVKKMNEQSRYDQISSEHRIGLDAISRYYIETLNINPLENGIKPSLGFHDFKNASQGAANSYKQGVWDRASFSDFSHWDDYINFQSTKLRYIYMDEMKNSQTGRSIRRSNQEENQENYIITYNDYQLINDIITLETPNQEISYSESYVDEDGEEQEEYLSFPASDQSLSKYLTRKIKEHNTSNIWDVVDEKIISKLKKNNLLLDMPSLYSSGTSRNWGLEVMKEKIEDIVNLKNIDQRYNKYKIAIGQACVNASSDFCKKSLSPYRDLLSFIKSLKRGGVYSPMRDIDEDEIRYHYKVLFYLWRVFRDELKILDIAYINEFEYFENQLELDNKIASSRLGYLIALNDLEKIKNGFNFEFINKNKSGSRSLKRKNQRKLRALTGNFDAQIKRLKQAGKVLLLDKPLVPNHITLRISRNSYSPFWKQIYENKKEKNDNLFDSKILSRPAYEYINDISYRTILNYDQFESAVEDIFNGDIDSEIFEGYKKIYDEDDRALIDQFLKLLTLDDHNEKEVVFRSISEKVGLHDAQKLREVIFAKDSFGKEFLYKKVLRDAAIQRGKETFNALDKFCAAKNSDHETLKKVFHSSLKVQDILNQQAGLGAAPKELMDYIRSMTDEEFTNIFKAAGAFLIPMIIVMASGAIIVATGGLGGAAIALVGISGLAVQGSLVKSEIQMKKRGDIAAEEIKAMAKLGFTTIEAYDEVVRSWAWTVIEAISIVPLIGILGRTLNVGTKSVRSGAYYFMKNLPQLGMSDSFKVAGRSSAIIAEEAEVELAKTILKFKPNFDSLRGLFKGASSTEALAKINKQGLAAAELKKVQKTIGKLETQYRNNLISTKQLSQSLKKIYKQVEKNIAKKNRGIYEYTASNSVRMNFETIDIHAAKAYKEYFTRPSIMKNFMDSYMKKFLPGGTAEKTLRNYELAKEGKFMWGTNWMRKVWYENTFNIAKNKKDFLRIHQELSEVSIEEFEDYLKDNIKPLTDIFAKAPMRLKDIPYTLIQGGPHLGKRVPLIHTMGEAIVIRKMANARVRLIAEHAKAVARKSLDLNDVVAGDNFAKIFKAFFATARREVIKLDEKKAQSLKDDLEMIKEIVVFDIVEGLKSGKGKSLLKVIQEESIDILSNKGHVDSRKLERLIFNPSTFKEEFLIDKLWAFVPKDKIFQADKFESIAHNVMQETISDKSLEGLNKYLSALKVILVKDGLGQIELF